MFYSNNFKNLKEIQHCFFSRKNGNSKGIYQSLNCGIGSKDDNKIVDKNLEIIAKNFKVERKRLINDKLSWLNQFNNTEAMYGLGGNLRAIFEVNAISKTTKYKDFKTLIENYNNLSKKRLIEKFRLPTDRIDIIPIAAEIYLCVAEKLRVDMIHSSFWSISNGMAIKKSII